MKVSDEQIMEACHSAPNMKEAANSVDLHFNSFKARALKLECWEPNPDNNKGKKMGTHPRWREAYPNDQIFVEESSYNRTSLKRRILEDELIEYKCDVCELPPRWNGKPMVLILDHINGVNNDNRIDNLRFVCSNCDSQLETYKNRNNRKGRAIQ